MERREDVPGSIPAPPRGWSTLALPPADTIAARWGRRLVTLPLYAALCTATVTALPVLIPLALLGDLARGRPRVLTRCLLFFAAYLVLEVSGVIASFVLWLEHLARPRVDRNRFLERNFALQCWWANGLFSAGRLCFGLRVEIESLTDAARGPFLFFVRHTSVADTVLPVVLISRRYDIAFRYVMKRELLWDPCLDIVGNRLPNGFVRRGSGDSAPEIRAVQRLLENLDGRSAVLLYPEGTRFTPEKRRRILERIEAGADARLAERARALRHVLPPRLGGALGLLEANPGIDVVFCAHTGLEGARSFHEFRDGKLLGATVRLGVWRVPFAEIPASREARTDWLFEQWQRIDEWIEERSDGDHPGEETT